jgi:hypothetical protein
MLARTQLEHTFLEVCSKYVASNGRVTLPRDTLNSLLENQAVLGVSAFMFQPLAIERGWIAQRNRYL